VLKATEQGWPQNEVQHPSVQVTMPVTGDREADTTAAERCPHDDAVPVTVVEKKHQGRAAAAAAAWRGQLRFGQIEHEGGNNDDKQGGRQ